jgi:beta-galactosidase
MRHHILGQILLLLTLVSTASSANGADWTQVAYDDAGVTEKQTHLVFGEDWRFENPGNADEAARTAVFGQCVEFKYEGLNPAASYKVKLRFFSDGPREERVKAGEVVLLNLVAMEAGKVIEREVELPRASYASGKLSLTVEKLAGPNAVVSTIEIFSTDPKALSAVPLPEPPLPVLTPRPTSPPLELGGQWKFSAAVPAGFEKFAAHDDWTDISVPGEWVMQGFDVKPETPAAYFRTFDFAEKPAGRRFKLRFSAVYTLCRVWLNGIEVGAHEGGFVPFEFDVTDALKPGRNSLSVSVQSESFADRLSCGSQYATHPLGGITRKVQLFSVPDVHLSDLKIETAFDDAFRDATLAVRLTLISQSRTAAAGSANLSIEPINDSAKVNAAPSTVTWPNLAPGQSHHETVRITVANPAKWDNEHPHLYKLVITLKDAAGNVQETVDEKFGFRQVEVRGNQVFVNGTPIKIHGVCRHEAHPLLGRALTPELWKKDAEIFREGSCNFIRTSHYPPAEEFIDECDRLGLFVELEAPLCWVGHGASDYFKDKPSSEIIFERLAQANLEAVQGYPNHPSVIMRSMANESSWSSLFARVHKAIRKADPTRPCTFHDQCWDNYNNGGSKQMPIAVIHYPGLAGTARCAAEHRPVHFGEYCHLESYNRRELATDPGLRDLWGQGLDLIWGKMRTAPGCFGGSIWAAIDDTFFLPGGETVGYGTWGPIDGWRRPKPEYWNMKKAYSPLRLEATCVPTPQSGKPLRLEVENRHDFTNLSELRFEWKLGDRSGTLTTSAPPGTKGMLEIPLPNGEIDGKLLEICGISPRGFVEDVWQVAIGTDPRLAPTVPSNQPGMVGLEKRDNVYVIRAAGSTFVLNAKTGTLTAAETNGKQWSLSGPELLLLSANGDQCGGTQMSGKEPDVSIFSAPCRDWKATSVVAQPDDSQVTIRAEGEYAEARGFFEFIFDRAGVLSVHYRFAILESGRCDPRQIGLVLALPSDCQKLSWRRKAYWSSYPDDHVGRSQGTADAFPKNVPISGLAGPRAEPSWSWSHDGNRYGSNDFRSTKMNIFEAALSSPDGHGVRVLSDGSQHVRSWLDGKNVRLLVADYANEGAPPFFSEYVVPRRPLQTGSAVEGTIRIELQ